MGNHESLQQQIAIYQPPPNQLVLIDPGIGFRIYQHRHKMFEVMAHKFTLNSQDDFQLMIQNFIARYQHHYFVSTMYLKCDDYSTCGGYIEAIVFYQRIFTNLSKIKDIPINDALHFYAVAFKGFQILYQRFGYFQIYEDMFFLSQDSKLKVWCNKDISKNEPQQYLRDKTGKQQDMVRKIIFVIGQNTDSLTDKIQLKQRLLANGVRNFQMALTSLREICRQFGLSVPERVQCMIGLPSEEVRSVLDQYASNLRRNYVVADGNGQQVYEGYMMGSSNGVNSLKMSNGNGSNMMLNTPHFAQSPHIQSPKTNQFFSRTVLPNNIPFQSPIQPSTPLIIPSQPSPMLQTFNKHPQTPSHEIKKGIDLSLSTKKDRPPSVHLNKSQSAMIQSGINNNKPYNNSKRVQKQDVPPPQQQSIISGNIINNGLRKNFSSVHRTGLLNTQVYNNNLNQPPNKLYYPQQVTLGQQFHKPTTFQKRLNYRFQNQVQQHRIIQPSPLYNNVNSIIYYSQPKQTQQLRQSSLEIKKPQILKHQSSRIMMNNNNSRHIQSTQSLKKSNIIHVHFTNNNNFNGNNNNNKSPVQSNINKPPSPPLSQPISRPSVRLEQTHMGSMRNPIRERRASSKSKNIPKLQHQQPQHRDIPMKNVFTSSIINQVSSNNSSKTLAKNASTPIVVSQQNTNLQKPKSSNPFQMVENSQLQNIPKNNPTSQQSITLNSQSHALPFLNAANSTSSRYLYSNKQLNDNIPDLKYYKKSQSPKKTINKLFDTKIQQLQSFNESRFNTIKSLNDVNNQHSQVIQIIGREKKDSITSAFDQQQKWIHKNHNSDSVKQLNNMHQHKNADRFSNKNNNDSEVLKFDNVYKNSDSFTDPKILQILKRPSSKALKNQLNSLLKKTSKTNTNNNKIQEFPQQIVRKQQSNSKIKQDIFTIPKYQSSHQQFNNNMQGIFRQNNNFVSSISRKDFEGFPSLSNLSQINKLQQNTSFNQQRSSPIFNNTNNRRQFNNTDTKQSLNNTNTKQSFTNTNTKQSFTNTNNRQSSTKKSRFSQQHGSNYHNKFNNRREQNNVVGISQFYNKYEFASISNNIDGPTYEYSFSSKKQIPMQDNNQFTSNNNQLKSNNNQFTSINNQFSKTNKYGTTAIANNNKIDNFNNNKYDDSTILNSKSGQFNVIPQKPYNFINRFNSNQSLASLQFQLSKKLTPGREYYYDGIKQSENDNNINGNSQLTSNNNKNINNKNKDNRTDEFYRVRVSSAQKQTLSNRKYQPSLDPQIGRDLQMFRKHKNINKNHYNQ